MLLLKVKNNSFFLFHIHRTGGFSIDEIRTTFVKLRKNQANREYFVQVDVKFESSSEKGISTFIIFRPKSKKIAPYRIENMTHGKLTYNQEGVMIHK